jgi:hypothetical protein
MRNFSYTFDAKTGELVIRVKADKAVCDAAPLSASGKTRVFASTGGNAPIALPDGRQIVLGLNAYTKAA